MRLDITLNALLPGGLVLVRPNYRDLMSGWFKTLHRIKCITYVKNGPTIPQSQLSEAERARLRDELREGKDRLVVYFGFASVQKGVDLVFQIADPRRDKLLLCFARDPRDPYHAKLVTLSTAGEWRDNARFLGYLPQHQAADILSSADAVVLPFRQGGGPWNTSALAVRDQGTLLISTSTEKRGYLADENAFYAAPDDIEAMKRGLAEHMGKRKLPSTYGCKVWDQLVDDHLELYAHVIEIRRI
jgi:glycosyltransferase involved in cell wall biosynthesis